MRPASTSSGLSGADGAAPVCAAPVAAVEGVSFASVVAAAGARAGVSLGFDLAAFGLAAAGFGFAPSSFALPASAAVAVPLDVGCLPVGALAFADDRVADRFAAAFAVDDFADAVDGLAAFARAVFARAARADVFARAVVVLAAPVVLERADVVVEGIAADIALAASVSDLTAVSIDLVAALIACSAVVIVLAEVVAFAAAVFSFAAADVTLVAAEDTDRALVAAVLVVRLAVAVRAALFLAVPAFADVRRAALLAAGLAAARVAVSFAAPAVAGLAELVRLALAVRGRVGFVAAGVVGTDLPPSGSVTGSLIPRSISFYTSAVLTHQPQKALAPQHLGLARPGRSP
jgi:hypothetical protein